MPNTGNCHNRIIEAFAKEQRKKTLVSEEDMTKIINSADPKSSNHTLVAQGHYTPVPISYILIAK